MGGPPRRPGLEGLKWLGWRSLDLIAALFVGAVVFLASFLLVLNTLEHSWWQASVSTFLVVIVCRFEFRVIRDAIDKYGGD